MIAGAIWNPNLFRNVATGKYHDDIFYDNLAFHLVLGDGFKLDFANAEWLRAYQDPQTGDATNPIANLDIQGVTATRAPGYPCFLAAVYHQFGRDWNVVFLLQWIILCSGLTTLLVLICRAFGSFTAVIAAVTMACDFGVLTTISQLMTEALATSSASVAFCCLIWAWSQTQALNREVVKSDGKSQHPIQVGLWRWAMLGLLFGLMIQFRTNFAAWLMIFCVLTIPWMIVLLIGGKQASRFLISSCIFFLTVAIVCFPWWYRNCNLLGEFEPLGTGSSIGWVGGYCNAALSNEGNWDLNSVVDCQREALRRYPIGGQELAVQEIYMGKLSREMGNQWARENWQHLPVLMVGKGLNHLALINQPLPIVPWLNALLLAGAVIGCLASWRSFGFWIVLILFFSLATTMLTWSHHGRYLIPVRPLIHCAAAIGTVCFWRWVFRARRSKKRSIVVCW